MAQQLLFKSLPCQDLRKSVKMFRCQYYVTNRQKDRNELHIMCSFLLCKECLILDTAWFYEAFECIYFINLKSWVLQLP